MTTTSNLRKILNQKTWEFLGINSFGSNGSGSFICGENSAYSPDQDLYFSVLSSTAVQRYSASENAWTQVSASLGGTFGPGACGETMHYGAPGGVQVLTATGGTTNTLLTTISMAQNATGYKIKIIEGPNAGNEYTIAWNTIGANSTLVLVETAPLAFTAATKYMIMTGSLWVLVPSATAATFNVYDVATNTWTAKTSVATWGSEGQLMKTHLPTDSFAAGAVTSATTTTVTVSGLTGIGWNWSNYEIEIVTGTGAGQFRKITAGGATSTFTIATAWTVIPDATSTYVVKGDRTALYLMGNGATTTYKYDVVANTWASVTPTTARAVGMASGGTADLIKEVSEWATPNVQTGKVGGQNGRYIYAFRGNNTVNMDVFDLALITWTNDINYGNRAEAIAGGSCAAVDGKYIYFTTSNTHRFFRFDVVENKVKPLAHLFYPPQTATNGDRIFITKYKDGTNTQTWLHYNIESMSFQYRMLII